MNGLIVIDAIGFPQRALEAYTSLSPSILRIGNHNRFDPAKRSGA